MVNHACKRIVTPKLEKSRVTVFQVYLKTIHVDILLFGPYVPLDSFFFLYFSFVLRQFKADILIFSPLNPKNDQHLFSPTMPIHKQEIGL